MGDFPLLLLFFIFYLIAGSSKKKKKKTTPAASRSPMRTRVQGEQADVRAAVRNRQTMAGFETAFAAESGQGMARTSDSCGEKRIHLHDVSDEQMLEAAEGEDPCHQGGEAVQEDRAYSEADGAQEALRQDVLRGVIMSEILMRPQQRRALQRSRREYHGY